MYLTQGIHRAVQRHPDKIALAEQGQSQSYRALQSRVAKLAGALVALGVHRGDRVAMIAGNSSHHVEYLLATWWLGAVANPLNTRWSMAEIVFALNDCGNRVLIVDDSFMPLVAEIRARVPALQVVIHSGRLPTPEEVLSFEEILLAAEPVEDSRIGGDELAVILYTGGTTGFPKGVMLSHGNFWNASIARQAEFPTPPDAVSLLVTPLFHIAGLGRLVNALIVGCTCVMQAQFRPDAVLQAIHDHRVTDIILVPSMIRMLLDDLAFDARKMASLQRIAYGASPMPAALLDRVLDLMPDVAFVQTYGMTESTGTATISTAINHGPQGRASGRARSAGHSSYGAEARIVDSAGQEVERGTVGEIVLRGPMIMRGYWNKPAETAAALRDGWLHTGDGGYMDDAGYIYVADRIKDMIISGGENIYSAEVENAVGQHPAVAACAVIGVPHAIWGEAVHAVVVLRQGMAVDVPALQSHCRQLLAGYKCPKTMEFRDELPMSAAGKVLKHVLREAFQLPKSQPSPSR